MVYDGLEAFQKALPPALAGYWAELLVGLLIFQVIVFLCEYFYTMCGHSYLGTVLGYFCLGRKAGGRTVCLLGLSDSGKTLLFLQVDISI